MKPIRFRDGPIAGELHLLIAPVCPIVSVRLGEVGRKSTWEIQFAPEATPQQRAAAQVVLNGTDKDDPKWAAPNAPVMKAIV